MSLFSWSYPMVGWSSLELICPSGKLWNTAYLSSAFTTYFLHALRLTLSKIMTLTHLNKKTCITQMGRNLATFLRSERTERQLPDVLHIVQLSMLEVTLVPSLQALMKERIDWLFFLPCLETNVAFWSSLEQVLWAIHKGTHRSTCRFRASLDHLECSSI